MEAIEQLLKELLQPDRGTAAGDGVSASQRPLILQRFTWPIPSPDATPYKNIYHGGEENEKREVSHKNILVEGPPFLGELKLEINWHYWCLRRENEFVVDQIRCCLISTRPNPLTLPPGAPPSQSFVYPEQSFGPVLIPLQGFSDPLGPLVTIPLRDVTVRLTERSISTTYTFNWICEYNKRLKRQQPPDCFTALFGSSAVECTIGSRPTAAEQLRRTVRRVYWETVVGGAKALGEDDVRTVSGDIRDNYRVLVEGKEFFVDKAKLAAASPVFAACFNHPEMEEGRSESYSIPNAAAAVVEQFLHFCSTGTLTQPETHVLGLLYLAHQYQIPVLLEKCQIAAMQQILEGCSVEQLGKVAGAAVALSLSTLLGVVHVVLEERMPGWTPADWRVWAGFLEGTPGFAVERCRMMAEMINS
ncbi:uncharacterized protein LOC129593148 isoform X2 [Paramacrobiotus metropolitanus]|uniref:uncharacterized protein LOC129593148 isoform X2 n=1 Tax=Paramacrobiotus metropolitanus TaxID=2943436 RepID=UPI0024462052|nr:uncharacterized protein LOC129593148 isoform X2 [Paramacrobiotus metropolitanus]